jgi:hypothetical protein
LSRALVREQYGGKVLANVLYALFGLSTGCLFLLLFLASTMADMGMLIEGIQDNGDIDEFLSASHYDGC